MTTYSEKLRDPRWQRKRLEIMQRDDFSCQDCSEKTKPLHVHHKYYRRGYEPWDYPDTALVTLCSDCHQQRYGESCYVLVDILLDYGIAPEAIGNFSDLLEDYIVDDEKSVAWLVRSFLRMMQSGLLLHSAESTLRENIELRDFLSGCQEPPDGRHG